MGASKKGDVLVLLQVVEVKGVVRKIKRIYWENVLEKVYRCFDSPGTSPDVNEFRIDYTSEHTDISGKSYACQTDVQRQTYLLLS